MATGGVAYRFSVASWQKRITSQLGVHAESGPEWFRVSHEHLPLLRVLMSHVAMASLVKTERGDKNTEG